MSTQFDLYSDAEYKLYALSILRKKSYEIDGHQKKKQHNLHVSSFRIYRLFTNIIRSSPHSSVGYIVCPGIDHCLRMSLFAFIFNCISFSDMRNNIRFLTYFARPVIHSQIDEFFNQGVHTIVIVGYSMGASVISELLNTVLKRIAYLAKKKKRKIAVRVCLLDPVLFTQSRNRIVSYDRTYIDLNIELFRLRYSVFNDLNSLSFNFPPCMINTLYLINNPQIGHINIIRFCYDYFDKIRKNSSVKHIEKNITILRNKSISDYLSIYNSRSLIQRIFIFIHSNLFNTIFFFVSLPFIFLSFMFNYCFTLLLF